MPNGNSHFQRVTLFKQMQEQSAFQLGQEVLLMVIQTALNLTLPIQNQV